MPGQARKRGRNESALKVSPADYGAFVSQIELVDVWLHASNVENHVGPDQPEQAAVGISSEARYEPFAELPGFDAYQRYQAKVERDGDVLAEISASFGVRFRSGAQLTPEIFDVFAEVNLPVNTWPYFREFLSTTMGRMGWAPLTLPALKRGAPTAPAESGRTTRRRRQGSRSSA